MATVTVYFYKNDGSSVNVTRSFATNIENTIPHVNDFGWERSGYIFFGWSLNATDTEAYYLPGDIW